MNDIGSTDGLRPGELLLIENKGGSLIIGSSEEVEQWIAAEDLLGAAITPLQSAASGTKTLPTELVGLGAGTVTQLISRGNRPLGTSSEVRVVTRDLSTGRFVKNVPLDPKLLGGMTPQGMMVLAALETVQVMLEEITEGIENVSVDVKELLNFAHAEQLGDVHGRRRFLHAVLDGYRASGSLSSTDWESIAFLGPVLEAGIEKLRHYLLLELGELNVSDSPSKRADRLTKKLKSGRWIGTFKLLVAAQDSFAAWQQLRLIRISERENEHLDFAINSARESLNKNLAEDKELADSIKSILTDYCVIHPNEVLTQGIGSRKKLTAGGERLAATVNDFLRYRGEQGTEWGLDEHANFKDGVEHIQGVVGEAQRGARRGVSNGLQFVAGKIYAKEIETDEGKNLEELTDSAVSPESGETKL